jgi:hypothetical protein
MIIIDVRRHPNQPGTATDNDPVLRLQPAGDFVALERLRRTETHDTAALRPRRGRHAGETETSDSGHQDAGQVTVVLSGRFDAELADFVYCLGQTEGGSKIHRRVLEA